MPRILIFLFFLAWGTKDLYERVLKAYTRRGLGPVQIRSSTRSTDMYMCIYISFFLPWGTKDPYAKVLKAYTRRRLGPDTTVELHLNVHVHALSTLHLYLLFNFCLCL